MENLKFLFNYWYNGTKKVASEEVTLYYLSNSYEEEIDAEELKKYSISLESWVEYADANQLWHVVTAIDSETEEPYAWANFDEGSCYVEFLDEYYRTYMRYCFDRYESQLFLYELEFWRYPDGNEKSVNYQNYDLEGMYKFTPEGELSIFTRSKQPNGQWEEELKVAEHAVNVSRNWEAYPDWQQKNYEGLFTLKRWEEGDLLKDIAIPTEPSADPDETGLVRRRPRRIMFYGQVTDDDLPQN